MLITFFLNLYYQDITVSTSLKIYHIIVNKHVQLVIFII